MSRLSREAPPARIPREPVTYTKDTCPDRECYHTHDTREPKGYVAWHEWAEKKSRTHEQERCPTCRLFVIWVKKREQSS